MCITVATGEAQRASGVPAPEFSKIIGNQQQGAPWLRKDGDRVLVVRPGETSYPIANAEEVATGKFYATAEEYWGDRPPGCGRSRRLDLRRGVRRNGPPGAIRAGWRVASDSRRPARPPIKPARPAISSVSVLLGSVQHRAGQFVALAALRRRYTRGPALSDLGEGFDLHQEIRVSQLRDGDRRTLRRRRAEIALA